MGQVNLDRIIHLNRLDSLSWAFNAHMVNWNSTIFMPGTLDFWTAIAPPPAARREYVGFNLMKELLGHGNDLVPVVIPAIDITEHRWF